MALIGTVEWLPPFEADNLSKIAVVSQVLPDGSLSVCDTLTDWPDGLIFRRIAQHLALRFIAEHYGEVGFSMTAVRGDRPKYNIYLG
mgnify:CR=1 FL=1